MVVPDRRARSGGEGVVGAGSQMEHTFRCSPPSPSSLSWSWPLPLGQALLQRTHGSRLASRGGTSFMKHGIPLLVGGKARHAQGQRLNRFEVEEREKVRERKGRGKSPPSFLCF